MRLFVRILGRIVVALLVLIGVAAGVVYALTERRIHRTYQVGSRGFTVPSGEDAVQRGGRLARVVLPCFECHGEDDDGKVLVDDFAMGRLIASNLTRGGNGVSATHSDENRARSWSERGFFRAIREHVRPD